MFILLYSHSKYTKNTILLYFSSLLFLWEWPPSQSKHFRIFVYSKGGWPISEWKVNLGGSGMNHSGLKAGVIMHPLLWEHQMYCPLPSWLHMFSISVRSACEMCVMLSGRGAGCMKWVYVRGWTARYCLLWSAPAVDISPWPAIHFCPAWHSHPAHSQWPRSDSSRDAGQVRMSSLDHDLQYFRLNFEQLCVFCMWRTRNITNEPIEGCGSSRFGDGN